MNPTVLVVDDEDNIRTVLAAMLTGEGYTVITAENVTRAKAILTHQPISVVLSDLRMDREDGLQLLRWIREEGHPCPVIILTAHGTVDAAVDAMKQGAFDFLSKPFEKTELARVLKKAFLTFQFQSAQMLKTIKTGTTFPMIGQNAKIQKIFTVLEKVAATDSTVLITGESGTGKELIAQAIHEKSKRITGPFIKINCAAIPETLMESELFGYERGAFTGAVGTKPGRFELADGGTLFLDEIGEMSTEMQVKLLRVLQDKCFERVGGLRTLHVDVRLVAATNRDLEADVKSHRFRADLFYRLNVVPITLPPLRERPDDIPLLVAFFVRKFAERLGRPAPIMQPETLELISQFPWPGNIRQLENLIERMVVMNETGSLTADQLPEDILDHEEQLFLQKHEQEPATLKDLVKDATRRIEKKAIEEALVETANNVTRAARKLQISRKGLQLKMKELGFR